MALAGGFLGYDAYQEATMTAEERLLQANLEALTNGESGGGGTEGNIVDCFSESEEMYGRTYYDCGPCVKQYDAKGAGNIRTCRARNS